MTRPDDRSPDMASGNPLDAAIEQALHGASAADDVAPFARFVGDLRVMADRPAPRPSAELAALLAGHRAAERETHAMVAILRPRRRSSRSPAAATRTRVAALGLAGKAAMVAAFATTAVAGAAAGVLPAPATHFLQRAIEVFTPFELPPTEQGALAEEHMEATGAGNPDQASMATGPHPAPTIHPRDVAGTPTLDGRPVADATAPPGPSSATAAGRTVGRQSESGDPTPRGRPHTGLPAAPHQSAGPANGQSPDRDPPVGPAAKNGHVPPGHAPPGAPHPGGGRPGDAPPADPGTAPGPLSSPKGPPPKPGSPGGPPAKPGAQGPHHARTNDPRPVQDPHGKAPSMVPGRPQRAGATPDGIPGRATQAHPGRDSAPPTDDRRGASHRAGPRATGHEARHPDGWSDRGTGSTPATGAPSSSTPLPPA